MTPGELAAGQWYRWHKGLWYVRTVSAHYNSRGEVVGGWVIIRNRGNQKNRTVDLVKFVSRARRDYWLDGWRRKRQADG
jgi:hypothetical protein